MDVFKNRDAGIGQEKDDTKFNGLYMLYKFIDKTKHFPTALELEKPQV